MQEELHSMRLFNITADNSVSPHTNPLCRLSTLTRILSSIYLKQNVAPKTTWTEQKDLQRVSWASHHQINEAHSCCGQGKARVGRQLCGESVQTAGTVDTSDIVRMPHGVGKFLGIR
jgi:hypothetical protein